MASPKPVCDVCGAPATHTVQVKIEVPSDSQQRKLENFGAPRHGCDDHRQKRRVKRLDGTVEERS